jgi:hypothetical protein
VKITTAKELLRALIAGIVLGCLINSLYAAYLVGNLKNRLKAYDVCVYEVQHTDHYTPALFTKCVEDYRNSGKHDSAPTPTVPHECYSPCTIIQEPKTGQT